MQKAYVIINLGTPNTREIKTVKNFLYEFLSDKCVLNIKFNKIIARIIASKRAQAYLNSLLSLDSMGVNLIDITASLAKKIQEKTQIDTFYAFRYGNFNNIGQVIKSLKAYKEIVFLPMYPQEALSTRQSTILQIHKCMKALKEAKYHIATEYFKDKSYIDALESSIKNSKTLTEHILVSFHSVPISHLKNSEYESQVKQTFNLLQKRFPENKLHLVWQSKMGRGNWLEPSCKDKLLELLEAGVKDISVICPAFACDCTETLVEIGLALQKLFLNNGGENFYLIDCLNDSEAQVDLYSKILSND